MVPAPLPLTHNHPTLRRVEMPEYANIMYDRRIIRGNTYAQQTLPAVSAVG